MPQLLLIPDPRPLVERLGADFFRDLPECPGVYLMRDAEGSVLYVGKARNLRKRLGSYRVANPDRMRRRHLRLLRAATRIDLEECADEPAALARESELLRALRPRFNRAGTWLAPSRFFIWRVTDQGIELGIADTFIAGWHSQGSLGGAVFAVRGLLLRLLWCALQPERGFAGMPAGWFQGPSRERVTIPSPACTCSALRQAEAQLLSLFAGSPDGFLDWIRHRTSQQVHPFELAALGSDMEALKEYFQL